MTGQFILVVACVAFVVFCLFALVHAFVKLFFITK